MCATFSCRCCLNEKGYCRCGCPSPACDDGALDGALADLCEFCWKDNCRGECNEQMVCLSDQGS